MKILRRVLITLVILAALVALGDRVANAVAENRVAAQVADTAAGHGAYSDRRPEVTIHGWPFVTQAWSGEFERIDITLTDVGAEGLVFPSLDMVARGVEADWRELADGGQVVARDLEVSGSVSVDSVEALLAERTGYDVSIDEDGTATLRATKDIDALGMTVELEASGPIVMGDGVLTFTPDAVESLTAGLPSGAQPLIEQLAAELGSTIALPDLPYGIVLGEIAFEGDRVTVSGSAEDVPLT